MTAAERRELIERAARDLFAERGYRGASIDEIARRAQVTPPVVYDHFESKAALHIRLLHRTADELLEMWRRTLRESAASQEFSERVGIALGAWADYVQANPYAARIFFRETTDDPAIAAEHTRIAEDGLAALAQILGGLPPGAALAGGDALRVTMAAQVIRGGLTELAIWWARHPDVSRDEIVTVAMATLWVGLERLSGASGARS
jgi:AcrR family transcriptional regulator